jgi:hypothetical protein
MSPQPPTPAVDPLLAVCLSTGVASMSPQNLWLTWTQIVQAFYERAKVTCAVKDQLLICFAHFGANFQIGSITSSVYAVALDFDDVTTEQLVAAVELAKLISSRGLWHTTWGDVAPNDQRGPDTAQRRFRIILPLDAPVSAMQWADTWQAFAMAFERHAAISPDAQCKNANRRYYVPVTRWTSNPPGTVFPAGDYAAPLLGHWGIS